MKFKIAEARKKLGYTQTQLADKVNVHKSSIGRIERGEFIPTVALLDKISIILKTPIDDLICREDALSGICVACEANKEVEHESETGINKR